LKDENCLIVLKTHPAELSDTKYYHSIAKQAHCKNYVIDPETDLYLLLASVDIVLTCFSTVGAEAVYFNKPLVIIDHLKQDIQKYYQEGVAFQASDRESIHKIVEELLSGRLKINASAYSRFIENYVFRIDGKVCDRICEFIEQF